MNWLTCVFLVLLRLAIGWHFMFEGLEKLNSNSWSSEPYLRESAGPLADRFRELAGDSVLDRYTFPAGAEQANATIVPAALDKDWNSYQQRFSQFYSLDADQQQNVAKLLSKAKEQTANWLKTGIKKVKRESPWGPPVEVEKTTPERVQEYKDKVREVRDLQEKSLTTFGSDVNARLRAAKTDLNRMRADLRRDINEQTAAMKKSLREVLTPEQAKLGLYEVMSTVQQDVAKESKVLEGKSVEELNKLKASVLKPEQVELDPVPEGRPSPLEMTQLERADVVTRWGIFLVGVCLIVGLFTRSACIVGAGFLLLFYLAMPPFPGVPDNPKAEGHYLYINKNIIEMLALLTLATTRSGRWVGLDGLVHYFNPFRRKPAPVAVVKGPGR